MKKTTGEPLPGSREKGNGIEPRDRVGSKMTGRMLTIGSVYHAYESLSAHGAGRAGRAR